MASSSRNEYLKSLNRMRSNYQNQGNVLINKEDDNGNVGEEMSAFAYMDTAPMAPEQAYTTDQGKSDEGEGYRFGNAYRGVGNSLASGVFNFFDAIGDFIMTVAGAISGTVGGIISSISGNGWEQGWNAGSDWAKQAVTYDWVSQATNFTDMTVNWFWNITSGDYWEHFNENIQSLSSPEASRARLDRIAKSGHVDGAQPYLEMGGELLPDIAITVATFGASAPKTAGDLAKVGAKLAVLHGAEAMGNASESAIKESGQFTPRELGYSVTKGAIGAGTSFALTMVGGQVGQGTGKVSGTVGKWAGKLLNSETAEVVAGTASNVISKSASAFGRSIATQSVDPYLKAIYDDGKAIEQAYGDSAKTNAYFKQMLGNATVSAVIAGTMTAVSTGASIKKQGWENYKENYIVSQRIGKSNLAKAQKYQEEYKKIVEDLKKDLNIEDIKTAVVGDDVLTAKNLGDMAILKDHLVSDEEFQRAIEKANNRFLALQKDYDKYLKTIETMKTDYKGFEAEAVNKTISNLKDSQEYINAGGDAKKVLTAFLKTKNFAEKYGYQDGNFEFKTDNGTFTATEDGAVFYDTARGDTLKLEYRDGEFVVANPTKPDVPTMFRAMATNNNPLVPTQASINGKTLNIPVLSLNNFHKDSTFTLSKDVSSKILNKYNSKEVMNFLESGIKGQGKNNFVVQIDNDNKYTIVEPYNVDGVQKYGIITVDNNNQIVNIDVKSNTSFAKGSSIKIVPKVDVEAVKETKAIYRNGSKNPLRVYQDPNNQYDGLYSMNIGADGKWEKSGYFIDSKKPFYATDLKKNLPFNRVSKAFNIPKSYEKTYEMAVARGTDSALKFISKYAKVSPNEVVFELGYDSYINEETGNVLVKDGSRIITEGGSISGKQEGHSVRDLSSVRRDVSDYTKGELKGYLGKNGRGIEKTQDRLKYAQVIKGNGLYEAKKGIDPDKPVKVIPNELYTKEMNSMAKFAKSLDCELYYAVGLEKGDGELGFYRDGKAVVYVDAFENVSVNKLTLHELTHHLFREWFAENNLNIVSQIKAIEYKSAKMRELVAKYKDIYKDVPFADYYEELACQLYSRNEELGGSLEKYQTRLIDRVNNLIKGGKENATQSIYDQFVAEENEEYEIEHGKYYARKPEHLGKPTERANEASVGIAVTYELTSQSTETIKENVAKYKDVAFKSANKIASILGLEIEQKGAIGGWTWTDNKNITTLEGEPSFPVTIKNIKNIEDVKLFASLMADTALEVQNSVGVFEYNEAGKSVEDTLYLKKIDDNLYQIFKSSKLEGFTLFDKEKRLVIAGASDDTMDLLLTELEKGDYLDNGKHEATKCNIEWLGLEERANLYETWLKNHMGKENRSVSARVKQAQKINKYILDNLEDGTRKPEALSNASEILKHLESPEKIISDIKAKSSSVLIEAGADVSKPTKYRLNNVKDAFLKALNEVVPDGSKFKLEFSNVKDSFAELNLARPIDVDTAINNIMKRIETTKITIDGEKYKLGDLLTQEQKDEAENIMISALNGKGEPTKLVKWAKSIGLEKLEKKEIIRHTTLRNRFERRIASSKRLNFGYGDAPITELTVFENILNSVPRYWDNKGVLAFADSVIANYNEDNIGKLFEDYGVTYDENINTIANNLKGLVVAGKHLDPRVQAYADDLMQLLYNNLETVDTNVRSENVKMAEKDANIIQSMYYGKDHSGKVKGTVVKGVNAIDNSVTSPIDYLNRKAEGTELQRFINEETGLFENKERRLNDKYDTLIGNLMNKDVKHLLNKKITFKGEKITYGVALDRINSWKTLGDKFFNAKGTIKNPDGTRSVLAYTSDDMVALENSIPAVLKTFNNDLLKLLNNDLWNDISSLYKETTHTQLQKLEDSIWYNISRVSDNFFGISMGGKSFKDMNLSMFNKRVNSRADINFNMDVITHVRNYYQSAFKTLVWQPYVNKINTILNTRVYGITNYKIYQENLPGFVDQMDLLFHQITGAPFETKVSTLSNIAGKVIGNLNAVRVATIQTGMRTLSSAPYFAKYFGGKVGVLGVVQNIKNGDILSARRNYKIITANSPYFKHRFTSEDVFLAQTGLHIKNKLTKFFGTAVRWGDASVHLTLGFSMAQVKAEQEGYGKPYTDSNNKRAVWLLEQASKSTQPTNAIGRVAGFRYGNGVQKYLWGLYGSMKQAFYDGLVAPVEAILTSGKKIKSMEEAIKNHDAKIDEYNHLADEAEEKMNNATDDNEYKEAKKEYEKYKEKAEGHKRAKKNTEDNLNDFKRNHTNKKHLDKLAGALGGLIFASLSYVAINYLIKAWEGKKDLRDVNAKDLALDTLEQSFINSLPYISTLYSSIKNNSDLSIATADNINNTIDAVKSLVEAIEKQDGGKITGATLKVLQEASMYFGIPLTSMLKLVNGTWYNIDKTSNLETRDWLGMLSGTKLRENYKTAYQSGNKDTAIANLEVWTNNYSIPTSRTALEEIYRLNSKGISGVAPSAISKTYTSDSGETLKYTSAQLNVFRNAYKKADTDVVKLIDSGAYKSLDDEYKGKAIAKTYSVYKEYASAKRDGVRVSSKLAGLLEATNGDMELAKYIAGLQQLSVFKDDEKKSRKEKVIEAINKMKGFTKGEKLLLAYLSGYSVSDNNKNRLLATLRASGFNKKDAKAYLGIE